MVAATSLAGCLGGPAEKTQIAELREKEFEPKNVNAEKEASFAWENHGDVAHVITSASDNWDMETSVQPGNVTSYKFSRSGLYKVVCSEHGDPDDFTGMRMKVAVGDAEIEEPVE